MYNLNIPKGYVVNDAKGWNPVKTENELVKILKEKGLYTFKVKGTDHYGFAKKESPDYQKVTPTEMLEALDKAKCYIAQSSGFMKIFKFVKA